MEKRNCEVPNLENLNKMIDQNIIKNQSEKGMRNLENFKKTIKSINEEKGLNKFLGKKLMPKSFKILKKPEKNKNKDSELYSNKENLKEKNEENEENLKEKQFDEMEVEDKFF